MIAVVVETLSVLDAGQEFASTYCDNRNCTSCEKSKTVTVIIYYLRYRVACIFYVGNTLCQLYLQSANI